jgi:hypothetical protein
MGISGGSDSWRGGGAPTVGTDNLLPGEVELPFGAFERKIVAGKTHAQKGEKFGRRGRRQLK